MPSPPDIATISRGSQGGGSRVTRGAAGGDGRLRTGRSRSPRRAAQVASRIALAGYAARTGDGRALAALGIDIGTLTGRSARHQCNVILNAVLDLPRTLQEQELRAACATTLILLLDEATPLPPSDVVRVFVGNYLFEIMAVEQASAYRENGDGLAAERVLRQTIDAIVAAEVSRLAQQVTPADLERVIAETLERARRIMAGNRR